MHRMVTSPCLLRFVLNFKRALTRAQALEDRVRQVWLEEILKDFPTLPLDQIWQALRGYLARAFRRHGIQTIALLDPSIEIAPEHSESLSLLLKDALQEASLEQHPNARTAISRFLTTAGRNPERARYITQLADGAFNYFSLTVAPDIAEQFRRELCPLTLFLDTNFLFGILDLHVNSQVAVSNDLLRAISIYKIPFKLRYHQATERELKSSIAVYGEVLRTRIWPQSISRAATTSRYLSGIELKYHQRHVESGIEVDPFLKPYEHVDILLKQKNIDVYIPQADRLYERANLLHEYQEFLAFKGREKPYELIDHDITVLDMVRQLRSKAKSSLEAGALLITCDYLLYKFDWELSRQQGIYACTVLPNHFWQILRPFVPTDSDFDRSFAETFAIPEFRVIGSGATKACSKMMQILSGYKDFPEEIAARMLSNDLIIDRLRTTKTDDAFQEYVDAAIVSESNALLEERAIITKQLEQEKIEKAEKEKQLEQIRIIQSRERIEAEQTKHILEQKNLVSEDRAKKSASEAEKEKIAKQDAEKRATEAEKVAITLKTKLELVTGVVKAIVLNSIVIGIFELLIYKIPWNWLINHQNSYGLQAAFDGAIIFIIFGVFNIKWRKWCWGVALLSFIALIPQLLGGPHK